MAVKRGGKAVESGLGVLDDEDQPVPRRGPMRKLVGTLVMVLVLALLAAGFYVVKGFFALNEMTRDAALMPDYQGRPAAVAGPLNILIIGKESRNKNKALTDIVMVAHLNAARDKLYLVSIPAGTQLDVPGGGQKKVESLTTKSAGDLTKAVEVTLGARMTHVVKLDFEGFVGLTNELGDITVHNPVATSHRGRAWPKGELLIRGTLVIDYIRQREGLANGDLDRARRIRDVTKAVVLKLADKSLMVNPLVFNDVTSRFGQFFIVDDTFSNQEMVGLLFAAKVEPDAVIGLQAPLSGVSVNGEDGRVTAVPNKAQWKELGEALSLNTMDAYWAKYAKQPIR